MTIFWIDSDAKMSDTTGSYFVYISPVLTVQQIVLQNAVYCTVLASRAFQSLFASSCLGFTFIILFVLKDYKRCRTIMYYMYMHASKGSLNTSTLQINTRQFCSYTPNIKSNKYVTCLAGMFFWTTWLLLKVIPYKLFQGKAYR